MRRPLSRAVKEQDVQTISECTTHITYQLHKGISLLVSGEIGQIPLNQGIKSCIIDNGTNQHDLSLDVMP